jgi:hypothetical protein
MIASLTNAPQNEIATKTYKPERYVDARPLTTEAHLANG